MGFLLEVFHSSSEKKNAGIFFSPFPSPSPKKKIHKKDKRFLRYSFCSSFFDKKKLTKLWFKKKKKKKKKKRLLSPRLLVVHRRCYLLPGNVVLSFDRYTVKKTKVFAKYLVSFLCILTKEKCHTASLSRWRQRKKEFWVYSLFFCSFVLCSDNSHPPIKANSQFYFFPIWLRSGSVFFVFFFFRTECFFEKR